MRPTMRFLSDDLCRRIVDEACAVLHDQGVNLRHDALLGRFADLGCRVDSEKQWVWFDREIVDRSLASAPGEVKLWNIAGDEHGLLAGNRVHFTPGSAGLKVLDYDSGRIRTATLDDMLSYGRLVEQLDHIDFSSTAIVPGDVPHALGDSIRMYALLKSTSKPMVTGAFTIEGFDVMRDLMLAVRGTAGALKEKPFAMFSCCPTSPLKWSDITADNTMKCAELGIPVEFIAMPMAGLVGPISLMGCVIQHAVETLSGIVISQTSCPGAPIVYGGSPGVFDMRSMGATVCAVEAQMIACAYAEVGKYLGLPTQAYIGMSDSKQLDAQSGFESGTGLYLAALAGINSISGPGMTNFETTVSLEKLVTDNELCGCAGRLIAGLEIREDFPAGPLLAELVREGNLLTSEHTLRYFREEHHMPGPVIDRGQLRADGGVYPDERERAHAEVERHLSEHEPAAVLSDDQRSNLDGVMRSAAGDFDLGVIQRRLCP